MSTRLRFRYEFLDHHENHGSGGEGECGGQNRARHEHQDCILLRGEVGQFPALMYYSEYYQFRGDLDLPAHDSVRLFSFHFKPVTVTDRSVSDRQSVRTPSSTLLLR